MTHFWAKLQKTGLLVGVIGVVVALLPKTALAACSTPTPTTAAGYQQLLRDPIGNQWYTADSGQSVLLPNGKVLWVFGDTLIGNVGETHADKFINNSAILTEQGCATSLTGANDATGNPTSWIEVPPELDVPGVQDYYWASTPFMDDGQLNMFLLHMYNDASGFHNIGIDLAKFNTTGAKPKLKKVVPTPASASNGQLPNWGAAVVDGGDGYTYIYGGIFRHQVWVFGHDYYLARVPNGKVGNTAAWRYWTGSSWSADQGAASIIIPGTAGVGAGATVYRKADSTYVMTSKKYDIVGSSIVAWTAASPAGPWVETTTLLSPVPNVETNQYTYFGLAHPEIPLDSGKLLLSWSLNSSDVSFFGDPRYGVYFTEVNLP